MPRKWTKFTDDAQRIMRKWDKAMGEEIPPALREPGDVEPATESKPVATEPVATEQVATEQVATEQVAGAKDRRGGNKPKHDEAQIWRLDDQHSDWTAGQILTLYKVKPGEELPGKRWVQRVRSKPRPATY
jgi:hypothetical protein